LEQSPNQEPDAGRWGIAKGLYDKLGKGWAAQELAPGRTRSLFFMLLAIFGADPEQFRPYKFPVARFTQGRLIPWVLIHPFEIDDHGSVPSSVVGHVYKTGQVRHRIFNARCLSPLNAGFPEMNGMQTRY